VLAVIFAYAAVASRVPALQRVGRRAPVLMLAAAGLGLVAAFALTFDHMVESTNGWISTLLYEPVWQGAWLVLGVMALAALFAPAPPFRWVFVAGILTNLALILLLVLTRVPYYYGMGDSAARMAIHVVPIAFLYFALELLPLLDPRK
jgi:cell division protein FtsW (lipid II flippase)